MVDGQPGADWLVRPGTLHLEHGAAARRASQPERAKQLRCAPNKQKAFRTSVPLLRCCVPTGEQVLPPVPPRFPNAKDHRTRVPVTCAQASWAGLVETRQNRLASSPPVAAPGPSPSTFAARRPRQASKLASPFLGHSPLLRAGVHCSSCAPAPAPAPAGCNLHSPHSCSQLDHRPTGLPTSTFARFLASSPLLPASVNLH